MIHSLLQRNPEYKPESSMHERSRMFGPIILEHVVAHQIGKPLLPDLEKMFFHRSRKPVLQIFDANPIDLYSPLLNESPAFTAALDQPSLGEGLYDPEALS